VKPLYVPPADDEPLDEIELALVRTLGRIFAREIREELIAEQREDREPRAADEPPAEMGSR
jgi:hypothetical protein